MKRTLILLLSLVYMVSFAGCVPHHPNHGYLDTTVTVNHNYNRDVHHPRPPHQPQHSHHVDHNRQPKHNPPHHK